MKDYLIENLSGMCRYGCKKERSRADYCACCEAAERLKEAEIQQETLECVSQELEATEAQLTALREAHGATARKMEDTEAQLAGVRDESERRRGALDACAARELEDDIGLSIDMLDVDRLREWARLLLVHGPNVGHWASVTHLAGKMQLIATGIERAVRDIGTLRDVALRARPAEAEKGDEDVRLTPVETLGCGCIIDSLQRTIPCQSHAEWKPIPAPQEKP